MKVSTNFLALFGAFVITFIAAGATAGDPELVLGAEVGTRDGTTIGDDRLLGFVIMPEMVPGEEVDTIVEANDEAVEDAVVFEPMYHAVIVDSGPATGFDPETPRAIASIYMQPRDFSMAGAEDWNLITFDDTSGAGMDRLMSLANVDDTAGYTSQAPTSVSSESTPTKPKSRFEAGEVDRPIASNSIRRTQSNVAPTIRSTEQRADLAMVAAVGVLVFAPVFVLYHRMRGAASLENKTRKAVFDIVTGRTGITANGISALAGIGYTTVMYHLRRLMTEGMVVESGDGHNRLYYQNGGEVSRDERDLVAIGRDPQAMRLLNFISEHPWSYRAEIANAMGVSTTTINWHLKKLVKSGLIVEERDGKNAFLCPCREKMGVLLQMMHKDEGAMSPTATVVAVKSTIVTA
ncbi:MAG: winged helix-turn-helix transcriptional regulator [Euryarchaeota archaeon]|nr:winged helix-turn-helix transcriptional regulator [Euryarchaeota archaeon]